MVFAVSMWFGLLAVLGSDVVGMVVLGMGLAMTMYVVAGFSEAPDPLDVGFRAALVALITGGAMFVVYEATDSESFLVLGPLVAVIIGAAFALNPVGSRSRTLARLAAIVPVTLVGGFVYTVDPLIYGVLLPLTPLAAVGFAEYLYERGQQIVAEDPTES